MHWVGFFCIRGTGDMFVLFVNSGGGKSEQNADIFITSELNSHS